MSNGFHTSEQNLSPIIMLLGVHLTEVIFTLVSPRTFRHIDIEPQLFEHPHSSMFSGEGQCCSPQLSAKRSTYL